MSDYFNIIHDLATFQYEDRAVCALFFLLLAAIIITTAAYILHWLRPVLRAGIYRQRQEETKNRMLGIKIADLKEAVKEKHKSSPKKPDIPKKNRTAGGRYFGKKKQGNTADLDVLLSQTKESRNPYA